MARNWRFWRRKLQGVNEQTAPDVSDERAYLRFLMTLKEAMEKNAMEEPCEQPKRDVPQEPDPFFGCKFEGNRMVGMPSPQSRQEPEHVAMVGTSIINGYQEPGHVRVQDICILGAERNGQQARIAPLIEGRDRYVPFVFPVFRN